MSPASGRTPLADPLHCRAAIDTLLGAYGDALATARRLPWASLIRVEVRRLSRPDAVEAHERRLVVRPAVEREVRRHVVESLSQLAATLDERWLEADIGEAARGRAALRGLVREHRAALDRRGPIRRLVDHLPIAPVVGALGLAWLVRPPSARPSAEELYSALVGVVILLQGRALLVLLARPLGAQAARSLLHAGEIDRGPGAYLERPSVALDRTVRWPFALRHHAIEAEDKVHEVCGLGRPRRVPSDLAFTSWHLALVGSVGIVASGVALDGAGRAYLAIGTPLLLWCLVGTRSLVAIARRRSRACSSPVAAATPNARAAATPPPSGP